MIRYMKTRLTIPFLSILLVVPSPGEAWNVPDGFQNLKWGMNLASVRALPEYEFIRLDSRGPIESWATKKAPAVGRVKLEIVDVSMVQGKLAGIVVFFRARDWKVMRDAAILKFGKPTNRRSLAGEMLMWESERLRIEAVQFVDYKTSSIMFETEDLLLAEKAQEQREREEAAAGFGAPPATKQAQKQREREEAPGGSRVPLATKLKRLFEVPELKSPVTPGGFVELRVSSGEPDDASLKIYLALIQEKVNSRWVEPSIPPLRPGLEKRVSISMIVLRSGLVRDIRIEHSSGDKALDQSGLRAVQESVPLPPFPALYSEETLQAFLHFVVRGE